MQHGLAQPGRWGDGRRRRIGLLGGSFNPAHDGHRHVARQARRALRLDQVWLLVSPGNPLKPARGMAPFARRLASARAIADGVGVIATGLEAAIGQRYSARTLARLRQMFPRVRFVWIIGADNLWQLPRWRDWRRLVAGTALAVLPRPGWSRRALHGAAAAQMRRRRRRPGALLAPEEMGRGVGWGAGWGAGWALVPAREHPASATALRQSGTGWLRNR
ncbi:nicotinate-nicotinamide nucleotide adenylyltransferase [Roseomonas sp. GC11]|uniref:nicotinate-nucleotide adenylyltransferase n=1 Tax=Roseomonas sp. GC11 TaxID=2950546 RepID=UPI00210D5FBB|nr:nicotinate-nucleotide adenylyltransferase [Roseomonas sp. GC11]MCQ4161386.1 nicotinate-nicotinamide nucleotide adenylyltransferase [Roseomonas sp. GC11]